MMMMSIIVMITIVTIAFMCIVAKFGDVSAIMVIQYPFDIWFAPQIIATFLTWWAQGKNEKRG